MVRRMTELAALEKPLIVAGCMAAAQRERVLATVPRAKLLPPRKWPQIVDLLDAGTACGDRSAEIESQSFGWHDAIVPIAQGCAGRCTYCITRVARGRVASDPIPAIVSQVRRHVEQGLREIKLTGQDTAAYGLDRGTTLAALLRAVAGLPGDFRVRVGMADPVVGWRTKERSRRLTRLRFEIAREIGEGFVGEEVEVLLTEQGKGTTVLARTPEYRQVVLPGPVPLGSFARVRIEEAHPTDLRGRVLGVVSAAPSPASPS